MITRGWVWGRGTDQNRQQETFGMRLLFCILMTVVITPMFFEEPLCSSKLITKPGTFYFL